MVKRIFNKRTKRGMAVLMAAAMVGTMSPVSMPAQPTWTVQAASTTKVLSSTPTVISATAIDYAEETLTLDWETGTDNKDKVSTVYYAVVTNKNFKPTELNSYPKASAYEAVEKYDMGNIDLSWVKWKADTRLFVTTDPDATKVKPGYVELAEQNTKLKISFTGSAEDEQVDAGLAIGDADNGYLVIDNGQGKNPDGITFDKMEYRTENGKDWKVVKSDDSNLSLKRYTAKGATLQMRVKATKDNPAGKTFKVKISAKAKAPKVTVDYLNQTVKLAKGVQVVTGGAADLASQIESNKWPTAIDKATTVELSGDELGYGIETTAMKIFVRTAAKDKKAASKVTVIKLGNPVPVTPASIATDDRSKPIKDKGTISIDYKTPYKVDSGIQLTNNTVKPMQFAIVKKDVVVPKTEIEEDVTRTYVEQKDVPKLEIANKQKVKWTTVNPNKAGTIIKIGNDKISADSAKDYMIIYRTADKKEATVSQIAVADFPEVLKQTIEVKQGDKNVSGVKVTTDSAVTVELELALPTAVDTSKVKYTAKIYKAVVKEGKLEIGDTSQDIKASVNKTKLTISGKASSPKVDDQYIVRVTREGATVDIVVTIALEKGIVEGTVGGGSTVEFENKTYTSPTDKTGTVTIVDQASATNVSVVVAASGKNYIITSNSPGSFSFVYTVAVSAYSSTPYQVSGTVNADGTITNVTETQVQ